MNIDFSQIKSFRNGEAGLIAGLCQEIKLPGIIDQFLEKNTGRPPEIPYGSLAQMMLINIADDHMPLSRLDTYFESVDLESLLGHPVDLKQLNDDRFGGFLDSMHDAGLKQIYSAIALSAFNRYNLKLTNVNFDTTSKVMWGEYFTEEGKQNIIKIDFGHSKQKRFDKKQIKFSLGTTQGIVIDGQVLSGNKDDKTFNVDNLARAEAIKNNFKSDSSDFFYIADSAAFTKEFLTKAKGMSIDVITRMTDNLVVVKDAFNYVLDHLDELKSIEIETSTKPTKYLVYDQICQYHDVPLQMAVCYSEKLKPQKEKTLEKRIVKENDLLTKLTKNLKNRLFACEADAALEIKELHLNDLKKLKYHYVNLSVSKLEKRKPGRPNPNTEKNQTTTSYTVIVEARRDEEAIKRELNKECLFVLASTKIGMSSEEILKEYKTQSAVERKFQFMKSPQFINALYLDSPKRIEALGYLLLILILLLSVAEYVVRRELKTDNKTIIGPGKVVMNRPSLIAIYRVFYSVITSTVTIDDKMQRGLNKPLEDNVSTILKYLGIPEDIYYRGSL